MLHFLYQNIKRAALDIFHLQILAVVQTILVLLTTWISSLLINRIENECESITLITLVVISLLLIAIRMWIGRRQMLLNIKVQLSLSTSLIKKVSQHILNLPAIELESMDLIKINQQINQDSNSLIIFALSGLTALPGWILSLSICGVLLIRINIVLLLLSLISVVFYSLLLKKTSKKIVARSKQYIQDQTEYFSAFYQWLYHWRLLKFSSLSFFQKRIHESFNRIEDSAVNQAKLTNSLNISKELLFYLPQMMLLIFGGIKVIHHELDLGYFVASISYLQMFLNALESFLGLADGWQAQISIWQRLNSLLSRTGETEIETVNCPIVDSYGISIDRFLFGDKLILNPYEKIFSSGKIYCLYGPNGSGKSTLLKLLANFYLDGKRWMSQDLLSSSEIVSFRKRTTSYLPQEPTYIDHLNVMDNLYVTSEKIPFEFHQWILELNEKKSKLKKEEYSIGQLQKISIMRTIALERPILLFSVTPVYIIPKKAQKAPIKQIRYHF